MGQPSIKQQRLRELLAPEIRAFMSSKKTLQLATVDVNGRPNISYAPFVQDADGYYVLISEMARHTQNIFANPVVSLMLIEDESDANNLYARTRLTFDAHVQIVSRETEKWADIIPLMIERLGNTAELLTQLGDFHLVQLITEQGLFVKGFGQAYKVSSDDLVDFLHLKKGHVPLDENN
ncbi:heme utilization protein HutZ [uncultured Psychromonas sp.]|uniref:heme utilization protein HutZ n=1 Tax=uncultured Psychromonas sp. TaxID=173974 RepID=UPI00260BFAAF|nr:heme utilization protein HutZ [uncultured Psychromonas sp.]